MNTRRNSGRQKKKRKVTCIYEKDVEDWMRAKCLESGTNTAPESAADVWKIHLETDKRKKKDTCTKLL